MQTYLGCPITNLLNFLKLLPIDLYAFMFLLVMEHSPNQPIPTFFYSKLSIGVPYYNFFKVLF